MINREDKADVKNAMGKAVANKVAKATNDSSSGLRSNFGKGSSAKILREGKTPATLKEQMSNNSINSDNNPRSHDRFMEAHRRTQELKASMKNSDAKNKAIHAKSEESADSKHLRKLGIKKSRKYGDIL